MCVHECVSIVSLDRKGRSDTGEFDAKWKEPDTEGHALEGSTSVGSGEGSSPQRQRRHGVGV